MQNGFHLLSKPLPGTPVNRGHPLAVGLSDCLLFNEGQGQTVNNLTLPAYNAIGTGSPVWGATPFGIAVKTAGAQSFDMADHGNYVAADFAVRIVHLPLMWSSGFVCLFDKGLNGSARELSAFFDTGGNLSYFEAGGSTIVAGVATGMTTGKVWDFVLSRSGATCTMYVNGLPKGSFSAGGTVAHPGIFSLGRNITSGGADYQGYYLQAQTWSRALGAGEVASLAADPYALFMPPAVRRFYALPGVPGGGFSRSSGLAIGAGRLSVGL